MRQLVTVQKIYDIEPIEGRDRVDKAKVLGWTVIVGKGQFEEGQLVGYAEVDSLFPNNEHWKELEKFKHRIKMFKVNTPNGPVYGQGYCFSLDKLVGVIDCHEFYEGQEITDVIGVTKWELPEDFNLGDSDGSFPTHLIPQTDETRIQSVKSVLEELHKRPYYIMSKIDGTSATYLINPQTNNFLSCSRNNMRKHHSISGRKCVYWDMAEKYELEKVLREFPNFALQGEIYGPSIQKNPLKETTQKLAIFNIFNIKERRYLDLGDIKRTFEKMLKISNNLTFVPILEEGDKFNYFLDDIIQKSIYNYPSGNPAEGIVVRPQNEMYSQILKGRLSFKCINPEFSCKEK